MLFTGYTILKTLHRGSYTTTYRAIGDTGQQLVRAPRDASRRSDIAKLRHEHQILMALGADAALRLTSAHGGSGPFIISRDPGGDPLRGLMHGPMKLDEVLWIAIGIVDAIEALHRLRIIHKDLTPDTLIVNELTKKVGFLSFAIASRLPRETHRIVSPETMEGALLYISPEQTGRMNRAIDCRTDFYSLGVTLHEMLTGLPPFAKTDPAEIIHAHIARLPIPPCEVLSSVPRPLSDLVLKLLAKNAEDRYQSCHGIRSDLESLAARSRAVDTMSAVELGARDVPDVLHVPQKLYGREAETAQLLSAFERTEKGRPELVLISGYSGIGKSALVSEVYKPIVRTHGFFISGKYEQYKRDIPYLAFTSAFQGLIRQLLAGSAVHVAAWKSRLMEALGLHGRVITDVIPEVEIIVGPQPQVPDLSPAESQTRFREVFQRFVEVFAKPAHPLVLFLDDLQWADSASLMLLKLLVTSRDPLCLLVLGAYRDNEVGAAHPLSLALAAITKSETSITNISLGPLGSEHVTALVADTLRVSTATAAPLARLLVEKTGSNPFFLLQFFRSLHEDKLLRFDNDVRAWQWSAASIRRMPGTENVGELMIGKLRRLPPDAQELLRLGACVGNQFDLQTLSLLADRVPTRIAADLWDAIQEGLIIPMVDDLDAEARAIVESPLGEDLLKDASGNLAISYRFLHDRVQQAAYSLLSEDERRVTHHRLGKHLLSRSSGATLADRVFDIVHHMRLAAELISDPAERRQVAELNRLAADRAKKSTAYDFALDYARAALALLPADAWTTDYELAMALSLCRSECEYLTGDFAEAQRCFDEMLARARTVLEKLKILTLKTVLHRHNIRYKDAIEVAITGLLLVDITVPAATDTEGLFALLKAEQAELSGELNGRVIAELIDLPEMTDPLRLATMSLLQELSMLGMFFTPLLVNIATLKMVILSLKHGNAVASGVAYETHGMILGAGAGDYAQGYQFGRMGIELSQRQGDPSAQCKCHFWFGAFISPFYDHISAALVVLKEACEVGLRSGDPVYVAYSAFLHIEHDWVRGGHLDEVFVDPLWSLVTELQSLTAAMCYRQAARSLMGMTRALGDFDDGAGFVDADHVAWMKADGLLLSLQHYYTAKVACLYFADRPQDAQRALDEAHAAGDIEEILFSQVAAVEHIYYEGLVAAALYATASPESRAGLVEKLAKNRGKIERWAQNCPQNFHHKFLLLSAEAARIDGRELDAITLYEDAMEAARTAGFVQHQALAAELAGRLHFARGRRSLAMSYFREARDAYALWGAAAKVRRLEETHPEIGVHAPDRDNPGTTVDLATVMKASQAISGEIVLEKLLSNMMRIMLENAGAQRGYFILERGDKLLIEAAGFADGAIKSLQSLAIDEQADLARAVVNYVARTGQQVVVDDAVSDERWNADPYVSKARPRSILASPIVSKKKRVGILYLENNLVTGAFTAARLRVLDLLSMQAAISIENAQLYDTLEQRVQERTRELLEARNQLVEQEKLASLGALTAGIAHEIKNPLNFVNNFAEISSDLCRELGEEVATLGGNAATAVSSIVEDLRENLVRINQHGKRADGIVRAMLEHSRGGTGTAELTDLNALIADNVNLSLRGQRSRDPSYAVRLEAKYDASLQPIRIVPQDIGRVILNLVNNAWYATWAKWLANKTGFSPVITVSTKDLGSFVEIRVRDNGAGISDAVRDKVFSPFFTTKPSPDGVGLGLSISHNIITQRNGGSIRFESTPGEFTEFVIMLPKQPASTTGSAAQASIESPRDVASSGRSS